MPAPRRASRATARRRPHYPWHLPFPLNDIQITHGPRFKTESHRGMRMIPARRAGSIRIWNVSPFTNRALPTAWTRAGISFYEDADCAAGRGDADGGAG